MNVAVGEFTEVRFVGDPRILVPITGKDALAAGPLKGEAKAADSAEKVDETEWGGAVRRRWIFPHPTTLPGSFLRHGRPAGKILIELVREERRMGARLDVSEDRDEQFQRAPETSPGTSERVAAPGSPLNPAAARRGCTSSLRRRSG